MWQMLTRAQTPTDSHLIVYHTLNRISLQQSASMFSVHVSNVLDFRGQRQTVWMNGIRRLHYDIIYCWPYSVKCGLGFVAHSI